MPCGCGKKYHLGDLSATLTRIYQNIQGQNVTEHLLRRFFDAQQRLLKTSIAIIRDYNDYMLSDR